MKLSISFLFAFFCGTCAHAQLVQVPGTIHPVNPGTVIGGAPTTHVVNDLHFGLDIVIPIPTLPGVPVYDLPNVDVTLAPAVHSPAAAAPAVSVARLGRGITAGHAAHPGGLRRIPAVTTARTSMQEGAAISGFLKKAGAVLGITKGEKVSESRLSEVFDGTEVEEDEASPVWVDAPSRPQTLPEDDLLREIGVY